jgi:hypothetical protein
MPCWLVYPELLRGAVKLIDTAARLQSRDVGQTHQLASTTVLRTSRASPGSPGSPVSRAHYLADGNAIDTAR